MTDRNRITEAPDASDIHEARTRVPSHPQDDSGVTDRFVPASAFHPRRITTTDQLIEVQSAMAAVGRTIISTKNHDYGDHDIGDPFANFRADGVLGIVVRMNDKLSRLRTFAKKGKLLVKDETARDSAIDLMNYAAIFVAYLLDEEGRKSNERG